MRDKHRFIVCEIPICPWRRNRNDIYTLKITVRCSRCGMSKSEKTERPVTSTRIMRMKKKLREKSCWEEKVRQVLES